MTGKLNRRLLIEKYAKQIGQMFGRQVNYHQPLPQVSVVEHHQPFSHQLSQIVEEEVKYGIELRKKEFIAQNPGVSMEELENLIEDIMYRGISPKRKDFNNSNWSFGQSFLFTVTVVTTIGE